MRGLDSVALLAEGVDNREQNFTYNPPEELNSLTEGVDRNIVPLAPDFVRASRLSRRRG